MEENKEKNNSGRPEAKTGDSNGPGNTEDGKPVGKNPEKNNSGRTKAKTGDSEGPGNTEDGVSPLEENKEKNNSGRPEAKTGDSNGPGNTEDDKPVGKKQKRIIQAEPKRKQLTLTVQGILKTV